jgi:hypothetical protein
MLTLYPWRFGIGLAFPALLLYPVALLCAQPASVEWSSVSKIEAGECRDGERVEVLERPGHMRLRFYATWRGYSEVDVELAPDGSGRARFHGRAGTPRENLGRFVELKNSRGAAGNTHVRVLPGVGERPIETQGEHGNCRWLWEPR